MKRVIVNGGTYEISDDETAEDVLQRIRGCRHPIEEWEYVGREKPKGCKNKDARTLQVFRCNLCGKIIKYE